MCLGQMLGFWLSKHQMGAQIEISGDELQNIEICCCTVELIFNLSERNKNVKDYRGFAMPG